MPRIIPYAIAAAIAAAPAFSQNAHIFNNPCERGPVAHWKLINNANEEFIRFLQRVKPNMPRDVATHIAYELCDDVSLVGDTEGLTGRLNILFKKHGY